MKAVAALQAEVAATMVLRWCAALALPREWLRVTAIHLESRTLGRDAAMLGPRRILRWSM